MNIFQNEESYESIILGGVKSPGLVTLSGHADAVGWDVKAGGGQDGASTTRKGREPGEFTASFYLVIDPVTGLDEHTMWDLGFLPVLRATFDKSAPQALDIYHPDLASVDIKSVVVKKIGGLVHDRKGGANVEVVFLKYAAPKKKASGKAKGSNVAAQVAGNVAAAGVGAAKPPDPNAAAKKELADLLEQAKRP